MIDNLVRKRLPLYVQPLIRTYERLHLPPNVVTACGLALATAAAFAVASRLFLVGLALWWLGRLFDGTDGIYARAIGRTTSFGAYLDILTDMAAYTAMPLALGIAFPAVAWQWTLVIALYVLCITSALALGAQETALGAKARDNRGLRFGAGLAEAGETSILYTLCLVFPDAISVLVNVWLVVLAITVIVRTRLAYVVLSAPGNRVLRRFPE